MMRLPLILLSILGLTYGSSDEESSRDRWHPGDSYVTISPSCNYHPNDFKDITSAAIRAIDFYEKNVNKQLVLDAAIGTRMIEAQITVALRNHQTLPFEFQIFLRKLRRRTSILSERIITQFMDRSDVSSTEKSDTIPWVKNASIWEMPLIWKPQDVLDLNKALGLIALDFQTDTFTEDKSDHCISEVLHGCSISNECSNLFLKEPKSMYSLTHQVIYMLLAFESGCTKMPKFTRNFKNGDWESFLENLCLKVWGESNLIAKLNYPFDKRDLFTEQIGICGLAGHPNFLEKREWLEKILGWQSKASGCFPEPRPFLSKRRKLSFRGEKGELRRGKRNEVEITTGNERCSVHLTSVSLTALAVHLRYFIDTCLDTY